MVYLSNERFYHQRIEYHECSAGEKIMGAGKKVSKYLQPTGKENASTILNNIDWRAI